MNKQNPIGVFDSGFGGISVVKEIASQLPHENIIFFGDSKYNPYGTKTNEEITQRCVAISDTLIEKGAKAIVIACNTATSVCVNLLRENYPIDFIGMEPALKVACDQGGHRKIAVWATEVTLREKKFHNLMEHFKDQHTIYSVPCPKLVQLVEQNELDNVPLVNRVLDEYIQQTPDVDSIVLGCTHFVFYRELLEKKLQGNVQIIDGNQGTVHHLKNILDKKHLLNDQQECGSIQWMNSDEEKLEYSELLLKR